MEKKKQVECSHCIYYECSVPNWCGHCSKKNEIVEKDQDCLNFVAYKDRKKYMIEYRNATTFFWEHFKNIYATSIEEVLKLVEKEYGHIGDLKIEYKKGFYVLVLFDETKYKNQRFDEGEDIL